VNIGGVSGTDAALFRSSMAIKTMNTNAASFEAGGVRRRTVQGSEWRVVGAGQWVGLPDQDVHWPTSAISQFDGLIFKHRDGRRRRGEGSGVVKTDWPPSDSSARASNSVRCGAFRTAAAYPGYWL